MEPTTIPTRQDESLAETFADVRFQCLPEVDRRVGVRISWIGNDGRPIESGSGGEPVKTGNESELVLRSVTKKSEGHYVCVAETDFDVANTTFRLSVSGESPTFISTEKDVRALEGSNVTVSCQANGLPLPKISWSVQFYAKISSFAKNYAFTQKNRRHPIPDLIKKFSAA